MWLQDYIKEVPGMNTLISTVLFLPMISAILCYILGRFQKEVRSYFTDVVTGITFGLSLYLFIQFLTGQPSEVLVEIPYVCGMGLHFTMDGFRAMYGMIAAFMKVSQLKSIGMLKISRIELLSEVLFSLSCISVDVLLASLKSRLSFKTITLFSVLQ